MIINDKMPVDSFDIDYGLLNNSFFVCISNKDKTFVDEVYEDICFLNDVQNLSIEDGKIGKFEKFERIFEINDEIPF